MSLCVIPTKDEVRCIIQSMHPTKILGSDGLPAFFFQSCWDFIKSDIMNVIFRFFSTASFLPGVNDTVFSLIPKKIDCEGPADYCPISLCNVLYKVVAKILANRIWFILDNLVSENQYAFVPGRQIFDNYVTTQELFSSMKLKKGKESFFALKTDMFKAYDRIEWSFLRYIFSRFGFPN